MNEQLPVSDWSTDYDFLDPSYIANPYPIWDSLRSSCPIAHTDRWGGSWLPTRYDDISTIAHDVDRFPCRGGVTIVAPIGVDGKPMAAFGVPPLNADPPLHTWTRRLMLSWLGPRRVEVLEPMVRSYCHELVDGFIDAGEVDVAVQYAQRIPMRVMSEILGIPSQMVDTYAGWVSDVLEFGHDPVRRQRGVMGFVGFFQGVVEERRLNPSDDFISALLQETVDDKPIENFYVLGMSIFLLIAGIDTAWSALASSFWHLATNSDDRERLLAEPELLPTAIEEFLRAYTPVTTARVLLEDVDYQGCPMKAGERVIMNFAAANRDPSIFPDANKVIIDRQENRHMAFGSGIHRCAGSGLARMEMRVALEVFLERIPSFGLIEQVEWSGGQVRGPKNVKISFNAFKTML